MKVSEPLFVSYGEINICNVDDGYIWLQHFPIEKCHTVNTMFDSNGEIVQWYIDICHKNGINNNIPWWDDLFLDIVILPSEEVIQIDADEHKFAFSEGIIDKSQYELALDEANKITNLINQGKFHLIELSRKHKDLLLQKIEKSN